MMIVTPAIELSALRAAPCAVCGDAVRVVMGDRGPVKSRRVTCQVGHFGFCMECLASTSERVGAAGGVVMRWRVVEYGPMVGHRWLVEAR